MVTKLLKKAIPAHLQSPVRRAVLFLVLPLRRRLRHTWRRRKGIVSFAKQPRLLRYYGFFER